MKQNRDQILKTLKEHEEDIRRFHVRRLGLFGSYARGENTETSDLDFVVEFDQKTFDAYMDLKFYLEGLFRQRVDLVLANTIKPLLRPQILADTIYAPGL
jgi:predicted nucleotidyltransferase